VLGIFLTGILLHSFTHADAWIRVRPHIVVDAESEVRLSQLVDDNGLSPETLHKLSAIRVSRAPGAGEQQVLSAASLMDALRPVVLEERRQQKVEFIVPKSVIVDTGARDLTADLVKGEILQAWQPLCVECRLVFDSLSLPQIAGVRDWRLQVKPELPRGSFAIAVELTRVRAQKVNAWVNGRLQVQRQVPVSTRLITAGERLQSQDIKWEYRDTSLAFDGIPAADEIPGKSLRQSLRAGEILWRNLIAKDRAIRRGEPVVVKSGAGDWEVSINAVAQQDAYIGDVITLKNIKTNSALIGQVVGAGEAVLQ